MREDQLLLSLKAEDDELRRFGLIQAQALEQLRFEWRKRDLDEATARVLAAASAQGMQLTRGQVQEKASEEIAAFSALVKQAAAELSGTCSGDPSASEARATASKSAAEGPGAGTERAPKRQAGACDASHQPAGTATGQAAGATSRLHAGVKSGRAEGHTHSNGHRPEPKGAEVLNGCCSAPRSPPDPASARNHWFGGAEGAMR
jgi:hypothetical protein